MHARVKGSISWVALARSATLCATVVAAGCERESSTVIQWEYANAFPPLATQLRCAEPNPRERALFDAAASALELGDVDEPNALDMGAQRVLAHGVSREFGNGRFSVCMPSDVLARASMAIKSRGGFGKGRMTEYGLSLAAKLPDADAVVIEAVAKVAFNEVVQPSEALSHQDIRPYARSVLAVFGAKAAKYSDVAYEQISIDTAMGTGAAQIAAATGHAQALPRVAQLMEAALATVPEPRAIPYALRNRLYELAWAVALAGDAGKQYSRPIHQLMRRQVQSWAPPFGMLELQPKRMCDVLTRVEGSKASATYSYCGDDKVPYES
jgi:hypothetical protein